MLGEGSQGGQDLGQGSTSNSNIFPGPYYLEYTPNGINLHYNHQHHITNTQESSLVDVSHVARSTSTIRPMQHLNMGGMTHEELHVDLNLDTFNQQGARANEDGPITISSGYSNYVLEENEAGEGTSSGIFRRVTCRRGDSQNGSRWSNSGECSMAIPQAIPQQQQASAPGLSSSIPSTTWSQRTTRSYQNILAGNRHLHRSQVQPHNPRIDNGIGAAFHRGESSTRNNQENGAFPGTMNVANQTNHFNFFSGGTASPSDVASSSPSGPSRADFLQGISAPGTRSPGFQARFSGEILRNQHDWMVDEILSHRGDASLVFPRNSGLTIREGQSVVGGGGRGQRGNPRVASSTSRVVDYHRRSRLVSEVRNALGLVRRDGALRLEDVMVIGPSVLYGLPEEEEPDEYEDMRLDIDSMSYELEEEIGDVDMGLDEDFIRKRMTRVTHASNEVGCPPRDEPCCICQYEYADGDDLGRLDCGHPFHYGCIKQWLVRKNSCPVCKNRALVDN